MDRNPVIDIAKTLGIALVVIGHITGEGEGAGLVHLRNFIYQFHVPLFFFLSGVCFKEQEPWKAFILKKIKRLYLPFVLWNMVFFIINIVVHALAGEQPILTDTLKHCVKIFAGLSATPLGGATWFLITLFQAAILYKLLLSLLRRWLRKPGYITLILSLAAGIFGMIIQLPYGLEKAFVAMFFVCAGHQFKGVAKRHMNKPAYSVAAVISGVVIVGIISSVNHPDMAFHRYGNIVLYLISAFSGIMSLMVFCSLISRCQALSFLGEWGKRTMWILIGHFAAFKIVTLVQILSFELPWQTIFTHPCNDVGKAWPVLYFIAGFFVPLFLSKIRTSNSY